MLNLTNYSEHPDQPDYMVFRFGDENMANEFRKNLMLESIDFEEGEEEISNGFSSNAVMLFGIHKLNFSRAKQLSYDAIGKYRKKLIPNAFLRYLLLFITLGFIAFGVIGYIKFNP